MNFDIHNITRPSNIPIGEFLAKQSIDGIETSNEQWLVMNNDVLVRNVRTAELIHFQAASNVPPKDETVIVAPGGGMMVMAMMHEGSNIATKLAAIGYDAYVLKYRLTSTPEKDNEFALHCSKFYEQLLKDGFGNANVVLDVSEPIADLEDSIRLINSKKINSVNRIHFLGFSAGAEIGRQYVESLSEFHQLASIGLIYGNLSHLHSRPSNLPELFAVMASDDPIFSRKGLGLIETWHQQNKHPEVHFFKNGGHGFGDKINDTTSDKWLDLYLNWLQNINN